MPCVLPWLCLCPALASSLRGLGFALAWPWLGLCSALADGLGFACTLPWLCLGRSWSGLGFVSTWPWLGFGQVFASHSIACISRWQGLVFTLRAVLKKELLCSRVCINLFQKACKSRLSPVIAWTSHTSPDAILKLSHHPALG